MTTEARLLSVGMTGGIACGRTTVGRILTRLGAFVVDMDEVAHGLVAAGGAAVKAVVSAFGSKVLGPDGGIDRRALGAIVFHDRSARERLEEILHPMILAEAERRIRGFAATHARGIAIADAALLVETGGWRRYQRLVVVACDPALQLQRLMARDGLNEFEARARIGAQARLQDKIALADYIIDTSGTLADSEARAREVYERLLEDLERLPDLPDRRSR